MVEPLKLTGSQHAGMKVERRGDIAILHVLGELDAVAGPQFEEAASQAMEGGAVRCIIDLTAATFIDSIGVGALIRAHRNAMDKGGVVFVAGAHGMIAQLIKITQLHRIFRVIPTLDEALNIADAETAAAP